MILLFIEIIALASIFGFLAFFVHPKKSSWLEIASKITMLLCILGITKLYLKEIDQHSELLTIFVQLGLLFILIPMFGM